MDSEKLESLLIDYIDGVLNEADREAVENELAVSEYARKLHDQLKVVIGAMNSSQNIEPDPKIRNDFQKYIHGQESRSKTRMLSPQYAYRIAAAVALVITGIGIGFWISRHQEKESELIAMKYQLEETRRLVMGKLGDELSPSQRLIGVQAAYQIESADVGIIDALIRVMNKDPNTNVRLAAIEGLRKFHREPKVREALIRALTEQTDPVVQIALIRLMVEMKEKGAVNSFREITTDEDALPSVKDEAYAGIIRLS
jgi:HEAT repeats